MPGEKASLSVHSFKAKLSLAVVLIAVAVLVLTFNKMIRNCLSFCRLPVRFLGNSRRQLRNDNVASSTFLEPGSSGLASDAVSSLPTVQFREETREGAVGHSTSDCAICLGEFGGGEWLRMLPRCSHAFHMRCIDTWFLDHSDCPLCRKEVLSDSGSTSERLSRQNVRRERRRERSLEEVRSRGIMLQSSRAFQTMM